MVIESESSPPTASAKSILEDDAFINSPLAIVYYNLRNEGYAHQVALWAAWVTHPDKKLRRSLGLPETQRAFAEWIGVSDRTIRKYAHKHEHLVEHAQRWMVNSILADYVPDALKAMGTSASIPNNYGTGDRRLLFEMMGVYKQKVDLTSDEKPLAGVTIYIPDNGRN